MLAQILDKPKNGIKLTVLRCITQRFTALYTPTPKVFISLTVVPCPLLPRTFSIVMLRAQWLKWTAPKVTAVNHCGDVVTHCC